MAIYQEMEAWGIHIATYREGPQKTWTPTLWTRILGLPFHEKEASA